MASAMQLYLIACAFASNFHQVSPPTGHHLNVFARNVTVDEDQELPEDSKKENDEKDKTEEHKAKHAGEMDGDSLVEDQADAEGRVTFRAEPATTASERDEASKTNWWGKVVDIKEKLPEQSRRVSISLPPPPRKERRSCQRTKGSFFAQTHWWQKNMEIKDEFQEDSNMGKERQNKTKEDRAKNVSERDEDSKTNFPALVFPVMLRNYAAWPSAPISGHEFTMSDRALARLGMLLLCLTTIVLTFCGLLEDTEKDVPMSNSWRLRIQALALFQVVVDLADASFVVPFSYEFSGLLRPSASHASRAFSSGIMQASSPFGMACGLFVAYYISRLRNYELSRFMMIFAPLIGGGAYILLGYALLYHTSSDHLQAVFISARFVSGCASGLDLLLSSLARDITMVDEQVTFSILEYVAMAMGLSLGPLVSTLSSASKGDEHDSLYSQEVRSSCLIGILYIIVAPLVYWCVPVCEDCVSTEDDFEESLEESHQGKSDDGSMWTMVFGCVSIFLGVFSCAGVEVSSSLVLELQYNWDVTAIGFAMSATYAGVIFWCGLVMGLQQCISDKYLIILSSLGCVAGCLLIFDRGRSSAFNLLFSDMLLYPCLMAFVGVVDGYLYVARPKHISTAGLNLLVYVLDSLGRALAAPTVRTIIVATSRNTYASLQLGIVLSFSALAAYTCPDTHSEERDGMRSTCH